MYVFDRQTKAIERVSVASNGTEGNNYSTFYSPPSISADGRYVAFESMVTNLVGATQGIGVFVHDRQTHATVLASVGWNGATLIGNSQRPTISADGRYVVFETDANQTVPDDNRSNDVVVFDRVSGDSELVSVDPSDKPGQGTSSMATISVDGRFVVLRSTLLDGLRPAGETGDGPTGGRILRRAARGRLSWHGSRALHPCERSQTNDQAHLPGRRGDPQTWETLHARRVRCSGWLVRRGHVGKMHNTPTNSSVLSGVGW